MAPVDADFSFLVAAMPPAQARITPAGFVPVCIFRNVAFLTAGLGLTMLASRHPTAAAELSKPFYALLSLVALFAVVALLLWSAARPRPFARRPVYLAMILALYLSLTVQMLRYPAELVFSTLGMTCAVFIALVGIGLLYTRSLEGWRAPLSVGLTVLVVASLIAVFRRSRTLELLLSASGVAIFSLFIVHHANAFMRHCEGEDCCTEGTAALFLDLANLFSSAVTLRS